MTCCQRELQVWWNNKILTNELMHSAILPWFKTICTWCDDYCKLHSIGHWWLLSMKLLNSFCSKFFSCFRIKRDINQLLKELLPTNNVCDISVDHRDKDGKNFLFLFDLTFKQKSCSIMLWFIIIVFLILIFRLLGHYRFPSDILH